MELAFVDVPRDQIRTGDIEAFRDRYLNIQRRGLHLATSKLEERQKAAEEERRRKAEEQKQKNADVARALRSYS